ncbi:MAG: flagellar basal body protein, partial [Planctomycetota bacterium]|nr:flagellar basal body protein [Planctomycetota bacterium]
MGLSQAMYSAISGLVNHQRAMDNIGNNLANVNTVGFKKGVFQFRTLLEQTLRGGTASDPQTRTERSRGNWRGLPVRRAGSSNSNIVARWFTRVATTCSPSF